MSPVPWHPEKEELRIKECERSVSAGDCLWLGNKAASFNELLNIARV
jgi:hypothetical protein